MSSPKHLLHPTIPCHCQCREPPRRRCRPPWECVCRQSRPWRPPKKTSCSSSPGYPRTILISPMFISRRAAAKTSNDPDLSPVRVKCNLFRMLLLPFSFATLADLKSAKLERPNETTRPFFLIDELIHPFYSVHEAGRRSSSRAGHPRRSTPFQSHHEVELIDEVSQQRRLLRSKAVMHYRMG